MFAFFALAVRDIAGTRLGKTLGAVLLGCVALIAWGAHTHDSNGAVAGTTVDVAVTLVNADGGTVSPSGQRVALVDAYQGFSLALATLPATGSVRFANVHPGRYRVALIESSVSSEDILTLGTTPARSTARFCVDCVAADLEKDILTQIPPLPAGAPVTLKLSSPRDGALVYSPQVFSAPPGAITLEYTNQSVVDHNVAVRGEGVPTKESKVITNDTVRLEVNLPVGVYEIFCSVPGHAAAGMVGRLYVLDPANPTDIPTSSYPFQTFKLNPPPGEVMTHGKMNHGG